MAAPNKRFKKLLDEGIVSAAKRQAKHISGVELEIAETTGYQPSSVQHWRRGNVPQDSVVAQLAHYCVQNGRVDRAWTQGFLAQARYPEREKLLAELFPNHPHSTRERPEHSRIFISYQGDAEPDKELASYLNKSLTAQGHNVFLDDNMRTDDAWPREIDSQLKASDSLVALLSADSADSEMMQGLISRATELNRGQGWPYILPVFVAYEGSLPYPVTNDLDLHKYIVWHDERDNQTVARDILGALDGHLPNRPPILALPEPSRRTVPQIDLRILDVPGGVSRLQDEFYIERDADADLRLQMERPSTITTIRAPRQTGKSSLLVRGLKVARENGRKTVSLDMQSVDRDDLASPERFLYFLAGFIVRKLRLDTEEVDKAWGGSLSPHQKLTFLLEDHILPKINAPTVLAFDEADRLLTTGFSQDFFSLVRSWHNKRSGDEADQWGKLNFVLVISTEPYLLIPDASQSPFNVGLKLYPDDFNLEQVRDLNERYGSPLRESDLPELMSLLHGHPYLTRTALYIMVAKDLPWAHLVDIADADPGPFSDHLRYHYWLLRNERDLKEALKDIIRRNHCADEDAFYRLYRAGLASGSCDTSRCRCELYRTYFETRL